MKTVLVTIISGQVIPNLLLINELKSRYSDLLFITTPEMEGSGDSQKCRSRWLERAANLEENSVERIIVKEDDWMDIDAKLKTVSFNDQTRYIVNLTGGTKVMTLAVFGYFAHPGNVIYYIPFPKNEYRELYPDRSGQPVPIKYSCTLNQYLLGHGVFYTCRMETEFTREETLAFFEKVREAGFQMDLVPEIKMAHDMIEPSHKAYYSGGWFEEFVFWKIRDIYKLKDRQMALGVCLYRNPEDSESDNEYDVIFTFRNALYVIECKSSLGSAKMSRTNLDKSLYKLGAVTKDFGLKVKSYVFTLTQLRNDREEWPQKMEKRREILGIGKIIDSFDFVDIDSTLSKLIK